jgi:RND family efflux transporter MFP subunit
MKKLIKWLILLAIVGGLAFGILRALKAREAKQQAAQAAAQALLVEPTFELAASDVMTLQPVPLAYTIELSGSVKATRSATVKASVAGNVVQWQVRAGETVKRGQVLGRIDARDLQARLAQAKQQEAAQAAATAMQARQAEDSQRLADSGFISPSALQSAQDSLAAAQANLAAVNANVRLAQKALADSVVRAPFSGQVAQSMVEVGDRVGVNAPMVQIVDLGELEWEAQITAAQLRDVRVGQQAQVRIAGISERLMAQVKRINPSLTPGSRNATLYLSLPASAGLRDGDFAQGELQTGTQDTLAVPSSAIYRDKPEPYVQTLEDGAIVHRQVQEGGLGRVGEQAFVAIQGVQAGQQVLRVSAGALPEGTRVNITGQQ